MTSCVRIFAPTRVTCLEDRYPWLVQKSYVHLLCYTIFTSISTYVLLFIFKLGSEARRCHLKDNRLVDIFYKVRLVVVAWAKFTLQQIRRYGGYKGKKEME